MNCFTQLISFAREYARASKFVFEFAGLRMATMPSKSQGALYDLNFFMVERADGWRLSVEYNSDLYREFTAREMLEDFVNVLERIAACPHDKISELAIFHGVEHPEPAGAVSPVKSMAALERVGSSSSPDELDQAYALPASYGQMRFWLLAKSDPKNSAYHMPACVRLEGPLSEAMLRQSLQVLTDRHEILRSTFVERNDEIFQVIKAAHKVSFSVSVFEEFSDVEREQRLRNLLVEEARRSFDLVEGPLCRARLIRVQENDHILIVTLHHIIADGWSQNIFQRELWSTYEALIDNHQFSPPPLEIQFGDFAVWQRAWLGSNEARDDLAFWKKQLCGPLPILDLVSDRHSSDFSGARGAIETLLFPKDLVLAAKALSKSEGATPFMLMFAGFAALLCCYTDERDILVGSPAANRRTDTEALIGPFSAPIALRLNLSGDPSLRRLFDGRAMRLQRHWLTPSSRSRYCSTS